MRRPTTSQACEWGVIAWLLVSTVSVLAGSIALFGWIGVVAGPVYVSTTVLVLRAQYYLAIEEVLTSIRD